MTALTLDERHEWQELQELREAEREGTTKLYHDEKVRIKELEQKMSLKETR